MRFLPVWRVSDSFIVILLCFIFSWMISASGEAFHVSNGLESRQVQPNRPFLTATTRLGAGTVPGLANGGVGGIGGAEDNQMSDDGRYVVFRSLNPAVVPGLIEAELNNDTFLLDRQTGLVTLVSRSATGPLTATGGSFKNLVSPDGRWVAFSSYATNLVPGQTDTNGRQDTFLFDRQTETITLVSHAVGSVTTTGNNLADPRQFSNNGRFLLFESEAGNLVPGQTGNTRNVFLFDLMTGTTILASRSAAAPVASGNGPSSGSRMSGDGRYVVFQSDATNLVVGQTDQNNSSDLFLFDRVTATTALISHAAGVAAGTGNGPSFDPQISNGGERVLYSSNAVNLVQGINDSNGFTDVFAYNVLTGTTELVSYRAGAPTITATGVSVAGTLNGDGNLIVFISNAQNVVPGQIDTPTTDDIFVLDRVTGVTALVSHTALSLVTGGNNNSFFPKISRDGRRIVFGSLANNLVAGQEDTNPEDSFLFDRLSGMTQIVSHTLVAPTMTGNGASYALAFGANDTAIVLQSRAFNLLSGFADSNMDNLYLFDITTGSISLISRRSAGLPASATPNGESRGGSRSVMSESGRQVVFTSTSSNLIPGQVSTSSAENVYLYDQGQGFSLISRAVGLENTTANGSSFHPVISSDGRFVAYLSNATNLVTGQIDFAATTSIDVFVFDRVLRTTTLVSHKSGLPTTSGNGQTFDLAISGDGNVIVFSSVAPDLVTGQVDTPGSPDIFAFERSSGIVTLVSRAAGSTTVSGNGASLRPFTNMDGRFITFESRAGNLVSGEIDSNFGVDVFLFDRMTQTTTLVSHRAGSLLETGNGEAYDASLSQDGNLVVFESQASNVVTGQIDSQNSPDIFVFDRITGTTTLVSHVFSSSVTTGNGLSITPAISADGSTIVFSSRARNLTVNPIPGPPNDNIFAFQRSTGSMILVSRSAGSATSAGNYGSSFPVVNRNGSVVAFTSYATNLVTGQVDNNNQEDVFAFDLPSGSMVLASYSTVSRQTTGNRRSTNLALSEAGDWMVFASDSSNLTNLDLNASTDLFFTDLTQQNAPDTIPATGLTCQQGSLEAPLVLATVSDVETPGGSLVAAIFSLPTGLTFSNLTNTNGTITATIKAFCGAPLGQGTIELRVQDSDGNVTITFVPITVTANTPPSLGNYSPVIVSVGNPVNVVPSTPLRDNGLVFPPLVFAGAGFVGTLTINPTTGVVSVNAAREGVFIVIVQVTDQCGLLTERSFELTVLPFGKGPSIGSISPTSGLMGTPVTISGFNLNSVTEVTFNGTRAAFTIDSAMQISTKVPAGATTGPLVVSGATGTATGGTFTVIRTK